VSSDASPIVLAFSGGLDTSFCVPWLKEEYGREVVTVTVDTGGLDAAAVEDLERRALALGAVEHVRLDCRQRFFDDVIRYLIAGNVTRGNAYPLCVGAERGVQAAALAEVAAERDATTVAHGCTGNRASLPSTKMNDFGRYASLECFCSTPTNRSTRMHG